MNKKIYISLICVAIIMAVLAILYKGSSSRVTRVGVITPLTGIAAGYGEEIRKGILSVPAGNIEFVFEDEKCEPDDAVSAFKKLTELDNVHFIIGPACGSPQEAIVPLLPTKDVLALVTSAASAQLYEKSGGNLFNIQYSLEDESAFIAEKMFEGGNLNIILIGYRNAFSETHAESFRKNFKGRIVREVWFTENTADVSTELAKIKNLDFDAIFSTDIAFFFGNGLEKLRQLSIDQPVYSQYAVELPAVRPLVEGVIYSYPGDIPGDQGAVYGLAREAAETFIKAIAQCGDTYDCVKNYLETSGRYQAGVSQRELILKQIKAGEAVEL